MATFAASMALGVEKETGLFAQRKIDYFNHFKSCLFNYSKMILFNVDNVPSKHIQDLRVQLRSADPLKQSLVVLGKNTLMRRVVKDIASSSVHLRPLSKLLPLIEGNVGFVFTNHDDPLVIARKLAQPVTTASAKPGSCSPCDVVLPKGVTNLGPEKTAFFRAVGISTRITKNQVELLHPVTVLKQGDRVGVSASELLDLLKIRPFEYRVQVKAIYENGEVNDLSATKDGLSSFLLQSEDEALNNVQALMLRGFGHILGVTSTMSNATDLIPAHLIPRAKDPSSVAPCVDCEQDKLDGEDIVDEDLGDLFGEKESAPRKDKKPKDDEGSSGGFGSLFGDDEEEQPQEKKKVEEKKAQDGESEGEEEEVVSAGEFGSLFGDEEEEQPEEKKKGQ